MKSLKTYVTESIDLKTDTAKQLLDDFLQDMIIVLSEDDKEGIALAKSIHIKILDQDFSMWTDLTLEEKTELYIKFYEAGRLNTVHKNEHIDMWNKKLYDWCLEY